MRPQPTKQNKKFLQLKKKITILKRKYNNPDKRKKMGKIVSNAKPCSTLPNGWLITKTLRTGGQTRGRVDKHYLSPTLAIFRSLRAAQLHIANTVVPVPAPAPAPVVVSVAAPVPSFSDHEVITIYDSSDEESEWL